MSTSAELEDLQRELFALIERAPSRFKGPLWDVLYEVGKARYAIPTLTNANPKPTCRARRSWQRVEEIPYDVNFVMKDRMHLEPEEGGWMYRNKNGVVFVVNPQEQFVPRISEAWKAGYLNECRPFVELLGE